jgi:hypothetical protein
LYDKLIATAADNYIPGNYEGSLLTFKSKDAIIWGLILKFGNLALVVMVSRLPQAIFEKSLAKTTEIHGTSSVYKANMSLVGYRILAEVLCHGGQGNSARI